MKTENMIASSMDAMLRDPEFTSQFSPSAALQKMMNKTASIAEAPEKTETELALDEAVLTPEASAIVTASDAKEDCVACGKKRAGYNPSMGVCGCTKEGCSVLNGCKPGCSCKCGSAKEAGLSSEDMLVKSAFNSLMKISADLDEAGYDTLSAYALILVDKLLVEAKDKKDKKKGGGDKEKAAKEKAKLKAEKEKTVEKAKKDKEAAKAKKEKESAKAEKDKNEANDKKMKAKEKAAEFAEKMKKMKADKAKKK